MSKNKDPQSFFDYIFNKVESFRFWFSYIGLIMGIVFILFAILNFLENSPLTFAGLALITVRSSLLMFLALPVILLTNSKYKNIWLHILPLLELISIFFINYFGVIP